jgi:hypothetical protein
MNTLHDLVKGLIKYDDPITVLELLDISMEELLQRFEDRIVERFEEVERFIMDEDGINPFDEYDDNTNHYDEDDEWN